MNHDPNIHNRRSIRLKGYDYSQAGLYFITLCCQDWICRFGHLENGEMHLNDSGKMVERWYYEMENKFPDKHCHEMIVMPNHFHCIIENMEIRDIDIWDMEMRDIDIWGAHVGAPLRGRPVTNERERPIPNDRDHPITDERERPITDECDRPNSDERDHPIPNDRDHPIPNKCDHPITECFDINNADIGQRPEKYGIHNVKYGATIGDAMDWFKTMTTNEYIRGVKTLRWEPFNDKLWQRNYWEHIIRDEQSYQRIANYIQNNPMKWMDDKFNDQIK